VLKAKPDPRPFEKQSVWGVLASKCTFKCDGWERYAGKIVNSYAG